MRHRAYSKTHAALSISPVTSGLHEWHCTCSLSPMIGDKSAYALTYCMASSATQASPSSTSPPSKSSTPAPSPSNKQQSKTPVSLPIARSTSRLHRNCRTSGCQGGYEGDGSTAEALAVRACTRIAAPSLIAAARASMHSCEASAGNIHSISLCFVVTPIVGRTAC